MTPQEIVLVYCITHVRLLIGVLVGLVGWCVCWLVLLCWLIDMLVGGWVCSSWYKDQKLSEQIAELRTLILLFIYCDSLNICQGCWL